MPTTIPTTDPINETDAPAPAARRAVAPRVVIADWLDQAAALNPDLTANQIKDAAANWPYFSSHTRSGTTERSEATRVTKLAMLVVPVVTIRAELKARKPTSTAAFMDLMEGLAMPSLSSGDQPTAQPATTEAETADQARIRRRREQRRAARAARARQHA